MIYTVTLNPSLDYVAEIEGFQTGRINRTTREAVFPGGKGLNVSRVLKALGRESIALGFVADFTGQMIRKKMENFGCNCRFVEVEKGFSRINVKLHSKEETEINGKGPVICAKELEEFYACLDDLAEGDYLVLAGSIPNCMSSDSYRKIMMHCQGKGVRFVVDATGELLKKVLPYRPFLIKPNHQEIGEIFQCGVETKEEILFYGKKLQEMGAKNVLISRAENGAILLTEDGKVLESSAPKGIVVNSVGAGDSMVAGFLAGYLSTANYEEALSLGVAAGSATAFHEDLATKEEIQEILINFH